MNESGFSVNVGKGGCDPSNDNKMLTLAGTEDCLIV